MFLIGMFLVKKCVFDIPSGAALKALRRTVFIASLVYKASRRNIQASLKLRYFASLICFLIKYCTTDTKSHCSAFCVSFSEANIQRLELFLSILCDICYNARL